MIHAYASIWWCLMHDIIIEIREKACVHIHLENKHGDNCQPFTAVSGVGSSPALATCETSQVLLAGVPGGFPGVLPFRPPIDWLVSMSEIILKGTLN